MGTLSVGYFILFFPFQGMCCPFSVLCAISSYDEVKDLAIFCDSAGIWRLWWLICFMSPVSNYSFGLYLLCTQKELQVTPPPVPAYTLMSPACECQQGHSLIWSPVDSEKCPASLWSLLVWWGYLFHFFFTKGSHSLSLGLPWTHSYPPAIASQVLGLQM